MKKLLVPASLLVLLAGNVYLFISLKQTKKELSTEIAKVKKHNNSLYYDLDYDLDVLGNKIEDAESKIEDLEMQVEETSYSSSVVIEYPNEP